jgi:DNA topoisomerase-1
MASAVFDQVVVMISTKDRYAGLKATGSTILFDGFYKVYGRDEENDTILPELANGDKLKLQDVIPTQHFTEPPPRYSEASLIKQLEEMGIGRPSTYASIISVLLDRKYVKIDKKRFVPEDRGRLVTAFLKHFFKKYVEYGFTASLEDKLDLISDNKLEWKQMLGEFWKDFSKTSEDVSKHTIDQVLEGIVPEIEAYVFPPNADGSDPKLCHECKKHQLHIRIGKFGPFIACNGYPECKYTRALHDDEASSDPEASHEAQAIGIDPVSQQSILLKHGPFGSYLEVQDGERLKRVHVPDVFKKDIHDINVAVRLLSLPREVGVHPETGESIKTNIGKFGPYLLYNKKFTSLQNIDQVFNINLSDALKVIAAGSANGKELGGYKGEQVTLNKGRFGPYIKFGKINVKVPKGTDLGQIDLEQAKQFIENHKK